MGRNISIRPAQRADASDVVELARLLAADHGDPIMLFDAAAFERDVIGPSRRIHAWVAVDRSGHVVGYAAACDAYERAHAAAGLYVCDIYVRQAHRRCGIGRSLLAAAAAFAEATGRVYLWWTSRSDNGAAHAFYQSIGASHVPVVAHAVTSQSFRWLAADAKPGPERSSPLE